MTEWRGDRAKTFSNHGLNEGRFRAGRWAYGDIGWVEGECKGLRSGPEEARTARKGTGRGKRGVRIRDMQGKKPGKAKGNRGKEAADRAVRRISRDRKSREKVIFDS